MSGYKIFTVARREYIETVKTKAFLLGLLLMPLMIVAVIMLSTRLSVQPPAKQKTQRLVIVDRSGRVAERMLARVTTRGSDSLQIEVGDPAADPGTLLGELLKQVHTGSLYAVLDIPADVLAEDASPAVLHGRGSMFDERIHRVRGLLNDVVTHLRYEEAGFDPDEMRKLARPVRFEERDMRGERNRPDKQMATMMTPFAFLFLLFMGVFGVSQGLLTSVIEEKSSRIVEVLLSALSPIELMTGKILGIAGVGFTLVLVWTSVAYGAAIWKGVEHLVQIQHIGLFLMYYVLGFLLIASVLAALGAACNTLKEAQSLMSPVTFVLIIPMICWFYITRSPNSTFSTLLSFFPPLTPFVMILRLVSPEGEGVPLWQQIAAPCWLAIWVVLVVWVASRVFRVGLLMYGKAPGLRELVRWVRY